MAVIGIDFGNVNSFPAFIMNMDERTRRGGQAITLLPSEQRFLAGLPTTYFYSRARGEFFGERAETQSPVGNRRNLLKRRFKKHETIDGRDVDYDTVITQMIQHIVRTANRKMWDDYRKTSDEISLAYPVDFQYPQLMHFVKLAQRATLENGRHVRVTGTIREPAAAALDYLATQPPQKQDYNIIVYDLGGGTFDISSVTVHYEEPLRNGVVEKYDVLGLDGLRIGGKEFDDAMFELFVKATGERPTGNRVDTWMIEAEKIKKDLSDDRTAYPNLLNRMGEPYDITISRGDYEDAVRGLVSQTVTCVGKLMARQGIPKPDRILLTGGQSQMPLIRDMLAQRFPEYRDRIESYKPQHAIAYGAARYGALEPPTQAEPQTSAQASQKDKHTVVRRTMYDIGLRNIRDDKGVDCVDTVIPAGTILPTDTQNAWRKYYTTSERQIDPTYVVEANRLNPDIYNQYDHYKTILMIELDFGEVMPKGTQVEICLYVDNLNQIHALERDPKNPKNVRECKIELKNIG